MVTCRLGGAGRPGDIDAEGEPEHEEEGRAGRGEAGETGHHGTVLHH